jgi:RNA polymerase sigma-70 factor (ECF subfamily)
MPTNDPDPLELLSMARQGDRDALGRLLASYVGYLKLLAQLRVDDPLRAKFDPSDVVQDTFLEAHRDFGSFRGETEGEFLSWLRRILASNLADQRKRYRQTGRRDVDLEHSLWEQLNESSVRLDRALIADQSSPSQQAAKREQGALLAADLEQLSADHREVLILRNLKELTFPEIAQHMNRSVGAVQQLWIRALTQLRERLHNVLR